MATVSGGRGMRFPFSGDVGPFMRSMDSVCEPTEEGTAEFRMATWVRENGGQGDGLNGWNAGGVYNRVLMKGDQLVEHGNICLNLTGG